MPQRKRKTRTFLFQPCNGNLYSRYLNNFLTKQNNFRARKRNFLAQCENNTKIHLTEDSTEKIFSNKTCIVLKHMYDKAN